MTETLSSSTPPPKPTSSDDATFATTIHIRPWVDPVIDDNGHDPRSRYVEQFWLGVLGPTATWLVRRLTSGLDAHPEGFDIDLVETAQAMGLSYSAGRSSPFAKALQRCIMFGVAHQTSDGLAVRRRIPTVAHRHLRRMPEAVQTQHEVWHATSITLDELSRAHQLAITLLEAGDDPRTIEHHLVALGVADAVAAEVADNVLHLDDAG